MTILHDMAWLGLLLHVMHLLSVLLNSLVNANRPRIAPGRWFFEVVGKSFLRVSDFTIQLRIGEEKKYETVSGDIWIAIDNDMKETYQSNIIISLLQ